VACADASRLFFSPLEHLSDPVEPVFLRKILSGLSIYGNVRVCSKVIKVL
jgi:hypothetical protein